MSQSAHPKRRVLFVLLIAMVATTAWFPWLTDEYAATLVVETLGGRDRIYDYLGTPTPLSDVPKTVVRVPFAVLVCFPSEAMYIVTFWGAVP